ncbi:MAG: helicase-related protein [Gammaproteobacteria bacterium]
MALSPLGLSKVLVRVGAEQLGQNEFNVSLIHDKMSQSERTWALGDFKQNPVQVLVANEVAASGRGRRH